MELGEKLRQSRMEAGLSQRQLCEGIVTRNMLSQIEHGTARPSMDTLRHLASRLEKPVSYFLDEECVISPNQERMTQVRQHIRKKEFVQARQLLLDFCGEDAVYDWERRYLLGISTLAVAEQALTEGKYVYARQLLEESEYPKELEHRQLLLLGRIPGADLGQILRRLPSVDPDLMLRAKAALEDGDLTRAEALLMAVENQETAQWYLLIGRVRMLQGRFAEAVQHLEQAQQEYPQECWPMLEKCCRELGDFRMAYEYRCKQG